MAEIKGRLLLPGGAPAAGLPIVIRGSAASEERLIAYGLPEQWSDPATATGTDGRFSIAFDPPLAYQFTLDVKAPGYAGASWRWYDIRPSEIKELGDVELVRGGTIVARIADTRGVPLTKGWSVQALYSDGRPNAKDPSDHGGRERTHGYAEADPSTGEYRLVDVPPGSVPLQGYSRIANWIKGPTVVVRADELTKAEIPYTGPDNSARIVVVAFSRPFSIFEDDVQGITLHGQGLERQAKKIARTTQSYAFDDLPPGQYTIEINDPQFLPWSKDGVEPGMGIDARLKGNAGIRLEIVDAETNAPLVPARVKVRIDHLNVRPNEFVILERGEKVPAGGLFDGLIPVDQTLFVSAPGYADGEARVHGLAVNEMRAVRVAMTRGSRLAGRVVKGSERLPLAGVEVELGPPKPPVDPRMQMSFPADASKANKTRTDAAGRFEFTMVAPGKYRLCASTGPSVQSALDVVAQIGADKLDLEVAMPDGSALAGRLLAPEGASFEGLSVFVRQAMKNPTKHEAFEDQRALVDDANSVPIAADGSFRAPAVSGEARVSMRLPSVEIPNGRGATFSTETPSLDLGLVTIAASGETVHDFDLHGIFPGRVNVGLQVNGAPGAGVVIELRVPDDPRLAKGAVVTDVQGHARSGPILCGTYRLLAHAADRSWFYFAPQTVTVKSAEVASASMDVELVEGALQMLDEKQSPMHGVQQISIHFDGDESSRNIVWAQLSTNAEGRIQLRMPPGRYRLFSSNRRDGKDSDSAPFEMTPSGPVPTSLVLTK